MPAEHIRKVAVVHDHSQTQFLRLDQNKPLAAIIRELTDVWSLQNPEDYSLQFTEPNKQSYINERNRTDIQNGNVLKLTFAPGKTAQQILDHLNGGTHEEKLSALRQLTELSPDNTFAQEFISKKGLVLVINMVEGGKYSGDELAYTLSSFVSLMDHSIVSWDIIENKFIKMVSSCISFRASTQNDATTLQSALEILESIVLHSSDKYSTVEQEVTPVNLVHHLQSTNPEIQKSAIAMINALFLKGDQDKRKKIASNLQSKSFRNVILNSVIRGSTTIGSDMAHQLYKLQSLLFNLLEEKMNTPIDVNDSKATQAIVDLRKIAFDTDIDPNNSVARKQGGYAKDYVKLGFKNERNPIEDFTQTPPGGLALDNMIYFARQHGENYTKVVLENSCRADEHDCPFARASIELTAMLCKVLKVGTPPSEGGEVYYPMFFTHDHPFEEFFCICIQTLNKTWKEMRATAADFTKVLSVVREQITRTLENTESARPLSFDQFKHNLASLTYSEITNIWQRERESKEEWESKARPIKELKEEITPEIVELIKQQRLNYVMEGTRFTKYIPNKRQKGHWYCRLSPNQKFLHYGDWGEENTKPPIESLPNKLAVVDIKNLLTGDDCPHMKKVKKTAFNQTAFSIISDVSEEIEPLNFIAPSEKDYQMWTDCINCLLGQKMTSVLFRQDLETLLSMEIKIRLLDIEGIEIPENPPPIPEPPPNYDFAYNYD
ncbi:unnamed protein product [Owenia fusiformis]|uniref:Uncharacterized protein n=1 Tax=Owenia fusiformis TaxID=6347 RepID=A0A8J1XHY4_OWEFU|nr:unnamed protein product [Owenia fusiformis]